MELLVVIAVIAILVAMVLVVLPSRKEKVRGNKCLDNLGQIAKAMSIYANDNRDFVVSAKQQEVSKKERFAFVQISLQAPADSAAQMLGLEMTSNSVWTCPNRPGLPAREDATSTGMTPTWVIGYQYFGGIKTWMNPSFPKGIASRSPVKLSQASPGWCLAADAVIKASGEWGKNPSSDKPLPFSNLPPHHDSNSLVPLGGNEVFVDGSARWIKFEEMHYLTTWQPNFQLRQCFFYQDSVDFDPALVTELPALSATKFQ